MTDFRWKSAGDNRKIVSRPSSVQLRNWTVPFRWPGEAGWKSKTWLRETKAEWARNNALWAISVWRIRLLEKRKELEMEQDRSVVDISDSDFFDPDQDINPWKVSDRRIGLLIQHLLSDRFPCSTRIIQEGVALCDRVNSKRSRLIKSIVDELSNTKDPHKKKLLINKYINMSDTEISKIEDDL